MSDWVPPAEAPVLETDRLRLRPFSLLDAPRVWELLAGGEIAAFTLTIPHPYTLDDAESYLRKVTVREPGNGEFIFAITERESGLLFGAIGLHARPDFHHAELGYWIGTPYWNQGYVTEAVRRVIDWGLREAGLRRIHAHHFSNNPASGAVMRKAGMSYEGTMRRHIHKWGEFYDSICYGILVEDLPAN